MYATRRDRNAGLIDRNSTSSAFTNSLSLVFDGVDEFVNMGNIHKFARTDAFSLAVWFKTVVASGGGRTLISARLSSGTTRGYSVSYAPASAVFVFALVSSTTNGTQVNFAASPGVYNNGAWHLAAMTYDGSSTAAGMHMYLDNVETDRTVVKDNLTGDIESLAITDFCLGANDGAAAFWSGGLDEAAVWNKVLTSGELSSLYNSGTPVALNLHSAAANLISWWRCGDEDSYPAILDNSGNTKHGLTINMDLADIVSDVP